MIRAVLFDWGDTIMRVLPFSGPMAKWPEVAAVPGAAEVLASLRGRYRLALATNAADSGAAAVREALARVDLDGSFELVLTAQELGARKPSREFYRAAMGLLGCRPAEAVMVGDDYEADILGAKNAGLWTIWVDARSLTRSTAAYPAADVRVHSLHEVPEALGSLVAG